MVQKHYYWLIALICILMTGCSSTPLQVYNVYEEYDTTYIVERGGALYTYDKENSVLNGATGEFKTNSLIEDLSTYGTEYTINHIELNKYQGSMSDAAGYLNKLLSENFELCKVTYKDSYLDVTVIRDVETVRVLYLGHDTIRIFYMNEKNKEFFPPYTNEKGVKGNG